VSAADRGAGTALAVGVVGAVAAATVGFAALVPSLVARHEALTAADGSALAAADVLLGAATGVPCDRASAVAAASGATIAECRVTSLVVRVRVVVAAPFGPVTGEARAGPDPAEPPE
jgi:secretion/DNA translocation related TadE-like protein